MRQENLYDRYWELLGWLEYEDKPSEAIWHPLFYRYPWGLRFELGDPALDDDEAYFRVAEERAQRIWDAAFAAEDEVLLIFDGTPDKDLKAELKHLRMQRVRAKWLPHSPEDEWDGDYFYRYLYAGPASEFSFSALLERAFSWKYGIYLYNRTKKLLFHPYDDRGADLLGPDAEVLRPFYESLHDFLLNWDREEMARKFRPTRPVFLRILTTTTDPERIRVVRDKLDRKLRGAQVLRESCQPYWKLDGWGELSLTIESARPLDDIRSRLAGKWESDTASSEFLLPDVGFLWVSE
ncbi:MAG: DUF3885 domain-containing protein [Oscillospiraceae bacterium]|nr:DUF3885 domain-containing protein [Oscillospiraceae bacterium]